MASRVIAIDGPAGSGKSTTAKAVAARQNLAHIDSGSLYRAVTLAGLDAEMPLEGDLLVEIAKAKRVELREGEGEGEGEGGLHPIVAGVDVSKEIRSQRVTEHVSAVSALPAVRTWVTDALRQWAERHPRGVVTDGRDVGTVVFPDAVLKIFLTAAVGERARRRALEEGLDMAAGRLEQLTSDIERRDTMDSTRAISPLKEAVDAVRIDTTDLTFDEQVEAVVERAKPYFPTA